MQLIHLSEQQIADQLEAGDLADISAEHHESGIHLLAQKTGDTVSRVVIVSAHTGRGISIAA